MADLAKQIRKLDEEQKTAEKEFEKEAPGSCGTKNQRVTCTAR